MKNVKQNFDDSDSLFCISDTQERNQNKRKRNKGMNDVVISKKIIDSVKCNPVELEQD